MRPTIAQLLRKIASGRPEASSLTFGDETLTYRQLIVEIGRGVNGLRNRGIGKGVAFAILSENRPELMIGYYAAAHLGAVFIPINPSLTAREVAHILSHSGSVVLFHDEAMRAVAEQAVGPKKRQDLATIFGDAGPALEPGPDVRADDDFLIIYTSGSTGTPKAVLFDQAAEIAGNASLIEMWDVTSDDVTLVALPLGFLYGLSTAAAAGLQAGGRVVILRRFHPKEVLNALVKHRVSIYHGVPTMYTMMLDFAEQNDLHIDLSFVRQLICAGAPLPSELKSRFQARFRKAIDDYYALTEVRPVFGRFASDPKPIPHGAIGRAAPGSATRIVDTQGRELPDGEQGEVLVRAPSTLKRYYNDDALTQSSFLDGFFRTGDLACRDAEGFYHLTGRIKDIIIRGGANIAPAEVESVIARHPAVQSAAVIGAPDRKYGEVAVAFVICRGTASISEEDLSSHCRRELAEYKVPAGFHFVKEFPLGITGKVDKNALKKLWSEGMHG